MTKMNRTKRLAREIQREKQIPYTLALREAINTIMAEHAEREGAGSEGLDRRDGAHPAEREG